MRGRCWLCGGDHLVGVKQASQPETVDSTAFRVTDAQYGQSAGIDQCQDCGFRQCTGFADVIGFYEAMEDPGYEASRGPRALQAGKIVQTIARHRPSGRWLDIGAGSGILVEAAEREGFTAEGVEPSGWMVRHAVERGLPVHHGVLPMKETAGPYDIVSLVDVIEHVSDPVDLLRQAGTVMAPGAIGLVITPDVRSMAARLMGGRWWHYRMAHIGYFERSTLARAVASAGLEVVTVSRPSWYFTLDYLVQRVAAYLPVVGRVRPRAFERVTIPLNLFDSLALVFRKPSMRECEA